MKGSTPVEKIFHLLLVSVERYDRGNCKHAWQVKIVLPSHEISCEEYNHQVADNLIPGLRGIHPCSLPKIVAAVVTVMAL